MAVNCEHSSRKLYAKGLCKACYLRDYHSKAKPEVEVPTQDTKTVLQQADFAIAASQSNSLQSAALQVQPSAGMTFETGHSENQLAIPRDFFDVSMPGYNQ